jgi:sugar O-acyltransferase (sialic acid O-acetyltransferase NeuD family)
VPSSLVDLVLVGGGGTGGDVLSIVEAINRVEARYRIRGLLDDALPVGGERHGVPVLGGLAAGAAHADAAFADCLGSPGSFRGREALLAARGLGTMRFATLVHPTATIASTARIGEGCIIYPNVVVLSGVTVGRHVTILANSVLNHGCRIGDFSILASGVNLSGDVTLGRAVYVGCGSNVREARSIGAGALVGLGSAVVADVQPGVTVAGCPARVIREAS